MCETCLIQVPVLVFANKSDLPDAMSGGELTEAFEMDNLGGKPWHVQQCCAVTGQGLQEGLRWLSSNLKKI
jgi:signal recognition particle receptor subunit beta